MSGKANAVLIAVIVVGALAAGVYFGLNGLPGTTSPAAGNGETETVQPAGNTLKLPMSSTETEGGVKTSDLTDSSVAHAQTATAPAKQTSAAAQDSSTPETASNEPAELDLSQKEIDLEPMEGQDDPASSSMVAANTSPSGTSAFTDGTASGQGRVTGRVIDPSNTDPEDVVDVDFIKDLSRFLASSYFPATSHPNAVDKGILNISLSNLNMRYGIDMTGLTHSHNDLVPAREEIFSYVLNPMAIGLLYNLYKGKFLETLEEEIATQERSVDNKVRLLSASEQAEFMQLVSQRLYGLAGAIDVLTGSPELKSRVEKYLMAVDATSQANYRFMRLLGRYQDLEMEPLSTGDAKARLEQAKANMDKAGEQYRKALDEREQRRMGLAAMVRENRAARVFSESDSVYIAMWVYRRLADRPERVEGLQAMSSHLTLLAREMEVAAR